MSSARVTMLTRYLTEDVGLSRDEMQALRNGLDKWIQRNFPRPIGDEPRRTLYLPREPLDDL